MMTKKEKAALRARSLEGESAYEAKITLKFAAKAGLSFNDVLNALFSMTRGDLNGITTNRLNTHLDLTKVDL